MLLAEGLDTAYPLDETAEAVRHLVAGRTQGKLEIAVAGPATQ